MTRSEFLLDRIACCKRNLARPNELYPNGRMAHDVERELLARSRSELADLRLDGYFDADGAFVDYAEASA